MAYSVYILTSWNRILYIGITSDLPRRMAEHRCGLVPGFTAQYRVNRLVHVEVYDDVAEALAREKQLKGWRRSKKVWLIEMRNPRWRTVHEVFLREGGG